MEVMEAMAIMIGLQ